MMLLHLLLHVLIYHLLSAKGGQKPCPEKDAKIIPRSIDGALFHTVAPKRQNYIIKHIDKCPLEGYYFTREPAPNSIDPGPCYLCFCQRDSTSVCWRRNNIRCNAESYYHPGAGRSDTRIQPNGTVHRIFGDNRIRRSPGYSQIFHRSMSQDVINDKLNHIQCKPYQTSLSVDCPPADWCRGCTVCDCGANGQWDCHLLKYCVEKRPEKHHMSKKDITKKVTKKSPVQNTTIIPKHTSKSVKSKKTNLPIKRSNKNKKHKKRVVKKTMTAGKDRSQKKKLSYRYQKLNNKGNNGTVMIIKRNIGTHNPIEIKGNKVKKVYKTNENKTRLFGQPVVKRTLVDNYQNLSEIADARQLRFPRTQNNSESAKNSKRILETRSREGRLKRQLNVPISNRYDPQSWRRRYKRSLATEAAPDTTSTTTTVKEDKPTASTVQTSSAFTSSTNNFVNPYAETFTIIPIPLISSNKRDEKDYYKYDVTGNESAITLRNKPKIDIHIGNISNKRLESILGVNRANFDPRTHKYTNFNDTDLTIMKILRYMPTTVSTAVTDSQAGLDKVLDPIKYLTDIRFETKDMDVNKWPQIKFTQQNNNIPETSTNVKFIVNKTNIADYNKRGKDVGRLTVSKKFNLIKIVKIPRCPFLKKVLNYNNTNITGSSNKSSELHNVFAKLIKEYNNAGKQPLRNKKLNAFKYWKRMLSKMFKTNNKTESLTRNHIIQSICENFGPCEMNNVDKWLLKTKIAALEEETAIILKTVKINKALLRLLEGQYVSNSTQDKFLDDIHKLSSILKGSYGNNSKEPLPSDKLVQIKLIKKNIQYFVKSVGRFTNLLHEIISLITINNINNNSVVTGNKNVAKQDSFQNLKVLLMRYNLVQNDLMKRMFEILNDMETQTSAYGRFRNKTTVNVANELNNTTVIDDFAKNIIGNIRKLKYLAKTLNSTRIMARRKREAGDDGDAMEYLLTLMEYLLKQNHPAVHIPPAHDGIDLLIEAIKNAPDIKTVRKKVLANTAAPPVIANATVFRVEDDTKEDESPSNSEDINISNSETINIDDASKPKMETVEEMIESKLKKHEDTFSEDMLITVKTEKPNNNLFQIERRAEVTPDIVTFPTASLPEETVRDEVDFPGPVNFVQITTPIQEEIQYKEENNTEVYSDDEKLQLPVTEADIYSAGDDHTESTKTNNIATMNDLSDSDNFFEENNTDSSSVEAKTTTNFNDSSSEFDDNVDIVKVEDEKSKNMINNINEDTDSIVNTDDNVKTVDKPNRIKVEKENVENFSSVDETFSINKNDNPDNNLTAKPIPEEGITADKEDMTQAEGVINTEDMDDDAPAQTTVKFEAYEPSTTVHKNPKKNKAIKFKSLDTDSEIIDHKSKLEWIVENFGTEEKSLDDDKDHEDKREDAVTKNTVRPTATVPVNVSSQSNEVIENSSGKKKKAKKVDDILRKKQLSLLNYLDYGTDRAEIEASKEDSKEVGNIDEKYADTFSAYFV